jgi:YidC/Oxa1 family membrane protein insertase
MDEQKNLIIAIALALAVMLGFNYFYERPKLQEAARHADVVQAEKPAEKVTIQEVPSAHTIVSRSEALQATRRIKINTPRLHGSINLAGALLDDITLADYKETVDPKSPEITLLSPENSSEAYLAEIGWTNPNKSFDLPSKGTIWESSDTELTPQKPVILKWKNSTGLAIERTIKVDPDYMFTITDKVTNTSKDTISLVNFAQVNRFGTPKTGGYYILHEGPLGVLNGKLNEYTYQKLKEEKPIDQTTTGGWLGITDKYWLVALIPNQKQTTRTVIQEQSINGRDVYQTQAFAPTIDIKAGETVESTYHVFAGAKKLSILDGYEASIGIEKFDLAVDFGWFYFITKPLFYVLDYLHKFLGNFGLAILLLTVLVKIAFFPLANKSYRSMSRMKAFQPKIEELKKRFGNDKVRMNQELMDLYRKEQINPLSGCLPMLIQAPIFFCLYKVLFVTIEMRHAPFYGWIHDLSAPDPTSVFNLFGLIPWTPPSFLMIGAWPILMGLTMFIQQKMNPQPADPAQAKAFLIMPIMLTFLLASFPAGLVIYWAWNNILSMAQQWAIMNLEQQRSKK